MNKSNSVFPLTPDNYHSLLGGKGISIRDYFATAIIQGMNANPELMQVVTSSSILDGTAFEKMARIAYEQADAMLKVSKGV